MRALISTIFLGFLLACANVTSPTGGAKDETPPRLKSAIPKQGQKNYTGTRIVLEFDEFIKLKNPKDEIIVTPAVKEIKFSAKKNLLLIDFEEKLQENTTYSISFRESIQDLNEGNAADDLHLAFSTGNEIDSLQISGTVSQLLRGLPADKNTVAVYQSDTFNIFKHKPVYFTRTNKKGEFKMQNLKVGEYFLYAFEDKNKNLLLESKSEKFGMLKGKINLKSHQDSIFIQTIPLDARPITIAGIRSLGHFTKVRFNKNLTGYTITSLDPKDESIRHCFSITQAEVDIFPTKPTSDSTLIRLTATDSLHQSKDSTFYIKQTTARSLKEDIKVSIAKAQFTEEQQKFYAEINTTELLKGILPDSVFIEADTIRRFGFAMSDIKYDTIYRKIRIEKSFQKKDSILWAKAKFVVASMAFTSVHGDSCKRSASPITHITSEESATLIIESLISKPNTLIEILDDRYNSLGIYPHNKLLIIKNIKPVTLLLRAIDDENNNGKWDPGNPNQKQQPENITYYLNPEGKQQIPLRANWEVNIKWNLK